MNKTVLALAAVLALGACGTYSLPGQNAGGSQTNGFISGLLQSYVHDRCADELQSRSEWQLASLLMSSAQQADWKNRICGCVSEEAPKQIGTADLPRLMTESGRTEVLADVTAKTVSACYQRLFTPTPYQN